MSVTRRLNAKPTRGPRLRARGETLFGTIAAAVGLGLSVAASAASSQASTPAPHATGGREARHARLSLLDRPGEHFDRSLQVARRKIERGTDENAGRVGSFPTPESVGVSGATLDSIASCESGGEPTAVSAGGTYRGKYQFDYGTWAAVGGSGDPAAAPVAEQDYRAALLYARGGSNPWPICGG
jgi:Transglycosylase-like domain